MQNFGLYLDDPASKMEIGCCSSYVNGQFSTTYCIVEFQHIFVFLLSFTFCIVYFDLTYLHVLHCVMTLMRRLCIRIDLIKTNTIFTIHACSRGVGHTFSRTIKKENAFGWPKIQIQTGNKMRGPI